MLSGCCGAESTTVTYGVHSASAESATVSYGVAPAVAEYTTVSCGVDAAGAESTTVSYGVAPAVAESTTVSYEVAAAWRGNRPTAHIGGREGRRLRVGRGACLAGSSSAGCGAQAGQWRQVTRKCAGRESSHECGWTLGPKRE